MALDKDQKKLLDKIGKALMPDRRKLRKSKRKPNRKKEGLSTYMRNSLPELVRDSPVIPARARTSRLSRLRTVIGLTPPARDPPAISTRGG